MQSRKSARIKHINAHINAMSTTGLCSCHDESVRNDMHGDLWCCRSLPSSPPSLAHSGPIPLPSPYSYAHPSEKNPAANFKKNICTKSALSLTVSLTNKHLTAKKRKTLQLVKRIKRGLYELVTFEEEVLQLFYSNPSSSSTSGRTTTHPRL